MSVVAEPEVLMARRAFLATQALLAGEPVAALPIEVQAGWHDTSVHPEAGAFAVIGLDSGLDDLIGEILLVKAQSRACFVYVMASADVPVALSLARRAWCSLAVLSIESMPVFVQAVSG